ncbi:hypothetical protein PIB30_038991 [Stylosanthes scabra]|uniref:Uncharacterized protein n=1 Tax=Stylosanthes scabra TaxID=79078 RepID=A0ABU6YBI5_9FABA|nr:hypothetical protein [Stylosanthes scabra]
MAALDCPHGGIVISTAMEKLPQPCLSSTFLSNSRLQPSSSQTSDGELGRQRRRHLRALSCHSSSLSSLHRARFLSITFDCDDNVDTQPRWQRPPLPSLPCHSSSSFLFLFPS